MLTTNSLQTKPLHIFLAKTSCQLCDWPFPANIVDILSSFISEGPVLADMKSQQLSVPHIKLPTESGYLNY